MAWKDLNIRERAGYIRIGVKNGLTNMKDIQDAYHKFEEGGFLDDATKPEPLFQKKVIFNDPSL